MKRAISLVMAIVFCMTLVAVTAAADLANILKPGRMVTAEQQKSFSDSPDTKYTPGYVLHNMDFSKVKSWEDVGYFVPNDGEFTGFDIVNGVLSTTNVDKTMILLTGNNIPKNIKDFTYTLKYRLIGESSRYSGPIYTTLDTETGKSSNMVGSVVRTNGVIDKATYDESQKAAHDTVYAAMANGEWATITASAKNGIVDTIVVECGGASITWTISTTVPENSYFSIRFSDNCQAEYASVRLVAGHLNDYTQLIWPGKEGDLVQNVTETALVGYVPPADTTPSTTVPAAPATFDAGVIFAAVAAISTAGVVISKKKR